MPRIDPRLVRRARAVHPHIAQLLPICKDLSSAERELRWLREHANATLKDSSPRTRHRSLQQYVLRRSRGEPLQYVLGSEYFGNIEIKCRPGVLIPRQETAASTAHLVHLLLSNHSELPKNLHVLDLCTGTGCIPLLFHHEFYSNKESLVTNGLDVLLDLTGVDISPSAVELAEGNKSRLTGATSSDDSRNRLRIQSFRDLTFLKADVLRNTASLDPNRTLPLLQALCEHSQGRGVDSYTCDILISNPPYISTKDYWRITSPSVRRYEPKLALVPPTACLASSDIRDGDLFYHRLLAIAQQVQAQVVLFEVADFHQAARVAIMAGDQQSWAGIEIWRDEPAVNTESATAADLQIEHELGSLNIPIRGVGNARSVLAYRGRGAQWLGKQSSAG